MLHFTSAPEQQNNEIRDSIELSAR